MLYEGELGSSPTNWLPDRWTQNNHPQSHGNKEVIGQSIFVFWVSYRLPWTTGNCLWRSRNWTVYGCSQAMGMLTTPFQIEDTQHSEWRKDNNANNLHQNLVCRDNLLGQKAMFNFVNFWQTTMKQRRSTSWCRCMYTQDRCFVNILYGNLDLYSK